MVINISDTHFSKRAAHKQRNSLIKPINPWGKTYQTKLILAHIDNKILFTIRLLQAWTSSQTALLIQVSLREFFLLLVHLLVFSL